MIKVLFFASIKEALDCADICLEQEFNTIADVLEHLSARGEQWQKTLRAGSVMVAVNQAMADEKTVLKSGDEVAFFPPVTGG